MTSRHSKPKAYNPVHSLAATIAVVLVGLYIAWKFFTSLSEPAHSTSPSSLGIIAMLLLIGAYIVVVTRRPSLFGWVVVGMEALILGCAAFGSSISVPVSSSVGMLGGAAVVFLPLLVLRLYTPRSVPAAA